MTAKAILQDMSICMECFGCRVACQMQNGLPPGQSYVRFSFSEEGTYPKVTRHIARLTCQHCADAACVQVCPTGACTKGESGLTHFDAAKCSGCAYCAENCPFGVPDVTANQAVRCVGCEALTENGKEPVCVQTCIAGALSYGPREEMLKKAEQRVSTLKKQYPAAQVYSPESVGGTAMVWVLRDAPAAYGLPEKPMVAAGLGAWKNVVQPAGKVMLGAGVIAAGLGWIIARRNHLKEIHGGEE